MADGGGDQSTPNNSRRLRGRPQQPSSSSSSSSSGSSSSSADSTRNKKNPKTTNALVLYDAEAGPSNGRPVDPKKKKEELEQLEMDESMAIALTYEEEELAKMDTTQDEDIARALQEEEERQQTPQAGGQARDVTEEAYEVETVLDKREDPATGEIEYYLKWKNWAGSPTWEPESNCECKSLIRKFERELQKRNDLSQSIASSSQSRTPRKQTARGRPPARKKANVLRSSSSSSATYVASEASNPSSRLPTPDEENNQLALVPVVSPSKTGRKQIEKRRSARLRKPPVEVITLGDTTSDTDPNNQLELYDKSSTSISPPADEARTPKTKRGHPIKRSLSSQKRRPRSTSLGGGRTSRPTKLNTSSKTKSPISNRAKSPPQREISPSSCSDLEEEVDSFKAIVKKRKLKLKAIVGCINGDDGIHLVVKWHGIPEPERVPLQLLRRLFCQQLLDFLLEKIKWLS